jgi:hypothetical protein
MIRRASARPILSDHEAARENRAVNQYPRGDARTRPPHASRAAGATGVT